MFRGLRSVGSLSGRMELISQRSQDFMDDIKSIGSTQSMDDYERRKLSIFNQLNFFQLITGMIVPVSCFFGTEKFPISSYIIASLPALVGFLVLCLNFYYKHEAGMIVYFILYPVVTSFVYLQGMDLGVELFFILYGILSVFFLQQISHMFFSVSLSMISYFILAVVGKAYHYQLESTNPFFYLFNQFTAIVFIFYGLFLIKKENNLYQSGILTSNRSLQEKNLKIQKQKNEIEEKAELLRKQTAELTELNSLKNKLFSVISHDLKSPMYALRNLFRNMQQYDIPAQEIKKMIPGIVNDLNYSTGLMENLLQWAKSQMQSENVNLQVLELSELVDEVVRTLSIQAQAKRIQIAWEGKIAARARADKEMISLVLRNLLSNAIKFTPEKGRITISTHENASFVEVAVEDTGIGITAEALQKINRNNYYTTRGTSSEAGTGLGLMLCREFLSKNGGHLHISSEPGRGSIFSFTLPLAAG
ncbi:MAG TPA: HAMP domain-containing sensor histidine kinase [Puia sp.]|nr:HAMP domain-containing sensor histidine kinase [Puia sp.]